MNMKPAALSPTTPSHSKNTQFALNKGFQALPTYLLTLPHASQQSSAFGLPLKISTVLLYFIQLSFVGLLSFQFVSSRSNLSIAPNTTLAPLIPITAILSASSQISSFVLPAYDSSAWMHFTARRTARTRSMGEGVPPCWTWPGMAKRDSNLPRDSSRIMLAITSVV